MAYILIVDPIEADREQIVSVVREAGHRAIGASSGKEGLGLYKEHGADLVITELFMPDFDGFELMSAIREDDPGAKVIVVSGGATWILSSLIPVARRLGAVDVLPKPFSHADLLEQVRVHTDEHAQPKDPPPSEPRNPRPPAA